MREAKYALVGRAGSGRRVSAMSVSCAPLTKHGKPSAALHTLCVSFLALVKNAERAELVPWQVGNDLEQAPVLLTASRTEQAGQLAYEVREGAQHDEA
jgi:hypothetical protein